MNSVVAVLETLPLGAVRDCLCVPHSKYVSMMSEYHTNQERLAALIKHWIFNDPYASWRKLIHQLDDFGHSDIADRIRKYAEKLTGQ